MAIGTLPMFMATATPHSAAANTAYQSVSVRIGALDRMADIENGRTAELLDYLTSAIVVLDNAWSKANWTPTFFVIQARKGSNFVSGPFRWLPRLRSWEKSQRPVWPRSGPRDDLADRPEWLVLRAIKSPALNRLRDMGIRDAFHTSKICNRARNLENAMIRAR
jgi:hypothetical protein